MDSNLDALLEVASGFWRAKVLLCAVGLDLFSRLDGRPASAEAIATELHLDDDAAGDLLERLAAMGLLDRKGDGPRAVYEASAVAARYLSTQSPVFVGDLLKVWNTRSYRMWANLETALRTGRPDGGRARTAQAPPLGPERFLASFDLSRHRRLCVLGDGSWLLAIAAARAVLHLECTILEMPALQPVTLRRVREAGLSSRISVLAGDFRAGPLPAADVYVLNALLHGLDLSQRRRLIQHTHDVLVPSGVLVAIEDLVDETHPPSAVALLTWLERLLELGAPSEPCFAEFMAWCRVAGFQGFERLQLRGSWAAAVAFKSLAQGPTPR
jgi:hypothetical protein